MHNKQIDIYNVMQLVYTEKEDSMIKQQHIWKSILIRSSYFTSIKKTFGIVLVRIDFDRCN